MNVRTGTAPHAGRPGWLIPLVVVGALIAGALLAGVLLLGWQLLRPGSELAAGPQAPGEAPPVAATPGGTTPADTPPADAPPVEAAVCQIGDPHFRGSGPLDGRLHGGGLGMPLPAGLEVGDPALMPYAFDVALVQSDDGETWAGVGAVRVEEPFHTTEQASNTVTACLSQEYPSARLDVTESAPVDLPGVTQAHEWTGTLTEEATTRDFRVLAADTDSPESFAVYVRVSRPDTPQAEALLAAEADLGGA